MKFNTEPIIGHHVEAEIYEPEPTPLEESLEEMRERLDIKPMREDERIVRITVGDVDWDDTMEVKIDVETFNEIVEWYMSKK